MSIVPTNIRQAHAHNQQLVERVAAIANDVLRAYCETNGYAFISRIKSLESIAEKIDTGRVASWSEIDDTFAAAVVMPTKDDVESATEYCRAQFDVQRVRGPQTAYKSPETFRFDSTRVVARLGSAVGVEPSSEIAGIDFEVQLRTAFEHAWIVATHPLTYKAERIDWRRQRLAAQLKASVEQLDSIVQGFDTLVEVVQPAPWPEALLTETVNEAYRNWVKRRWIPSETRVKDVTRFGANIVELAYAGNVLQRRAELATQLERMQRLLAYVGRELKNYYEDGAFPMSLSLFQLFLGIWKEAGLLPDSLSKFHVNVTDELLSLFPSTGQLTPRFRT